MSNKTVEQGEAPRTVTPGRIRKLSLHGFRSLRGVEVELASRFTVLIGPNGAGKSSVLDAAHILSRMAVGHDYESSQSGGIAGLVLKNEHAVEHVITRAGNVLAVELGLATSEFAFWFSGVPREHFPSYRLGCGEPNSIDGPPPWAGEKQADVEDRSAMAELRGRKELLELGPSVRLRLSARRAAAPSVSDQEVPQVGSDGTGLASAFAYLASNYPEARAAIEHDLATLVPNARRVRTPRVKSTYWSDGVINLDTPADIADLMGRRVQHSAWADTLQVEFAQAGFLPVHQLSEGTILALTLLTILHDPSRPNLVLLDDIDQGLHPDAQRELMSSVRRLMAHKPELQIIATTHAPYMLDCFAPSEVWVLALDGEGHTRARRFDQHPDAATLLRTLHLSEMWSGLGEDWVLGSGPEPTE